MAVRNLKDFEQALNGAVLARAAVQQIERNIRLETCEYGGDVARHVDARDPIAVAVKRIGTGFAGTQRHLTLGRPATHQNRDVLHLGYLSIAAGQSSVSEVRVISMSSTLVLRSRPKVGVSKDG